jgi:hypothetical protein
MITEIEFKNILEINDKIKFNNNTFFGSPLKKFINNIYNKFEIPKESFIISLCYLYNFYNINKEDTILMNHFSYYINYYILSSIIITLKNLLDEPFSLKLMCEILYLDYELLIKIELTILKGIQWNTYYDNNNDTFLKFSNTTLLVF